jgi:tRNA pseudouridine32 synthase/23S rRNA pseudouridine746 synthase
MNSSQSTLIIDNFVAPKCIDTFSILYEDDDILVIDKPSGLLSLSGKNPVNWDSVHYRLVNGQKGVTPAFSNAKLVHRLDFGTSGIMLVSLNDLASKRLNKQFQLRNVEKHYVAMLEGCISAGEGQIDAPIAKDKQLFPRVKICKLEGKPAVTEFKVIERLTNPNRTYVHFTPITGRTHQLRIHSHFIGHPILGCDLYKSAQSEELSKRLQLHASDLFFDHPSTHQAIHIHCPSPF